MSSVSIQTTEHYRSWKDDALVAHILETGETSAFEVIYDRYAQKIFRKCLSFAKDQSIAEDLTHDIMMSIFTKLSTFSGKAKFSTWVYAVTYNYCVDYTRKKTKLNEASDRYLNDLSLQSDNFDDYELKISEEKIDQLRIVLDKITPSDKAILLMKYQDDISIKEIAYSLQISESAVKMRLKRAKEKVLSEFDLIEKNNIVDEYK